MSDRKPKTRMNPVLPLFVFFVVFLVVTQWASQQGLVSDMAVAGLTFLAVFVMFIGVKIINARYVPRIIETLEQEAGKRGVALEKNIGFSERVVQYYREGWDNPWYIFRFDHQGQPVRVLWPDRSRTSQYSMAMGGAQGPARVYVEIKSEKRNPDFYSPYLERIKHLQPKLEFEDNVMFVSSEQVNYQTDQLSEFIDTSLQMGGF